MDEREYATSDACRFAQVLCDVSLPVWRAAALTPCADPSARGRAARRCPELAREVNALHLWNAMDDLETALNRLRFPEALRVVRGHREQEQITHATRRAAQALVARPRLTDDDFQLLYGGFGMVYAIEGVPAGMVR